MVYVLLLVTVALIGCVGLWKGSTRPHMQEGYAILAIGPLVLLICLAALGAL